MNQTNESLVRERDFYRSKLESLEKQVKTLGTDCAYLQKQNETLRVKGFENWTYDVDNVEGALEIRHKGIDNHVK